jgi:hypothetical protein
LAALSQKLYFNAGFHLNLTVLLSLTVLSVTAADLFGVASAFSCNGDFRIVAPLTSNCVAKTSRLAKGSAVNGQLAHGKSSAIGSMLLRLFCEQTRR